MKTSVTLYAPPSYARATVAVREQVVNGCGPGGWLGELVPERIWGLSIHAACDIHDWMYATGETMADKNEADDVFRNNLLRLITAAGGPWWLKALRRHRALVYFAAVRSFGGPAFWAGKNPTETAYIADFIVSHTWTFNWDSALLAWIKSLFNRR